MKHDIVPRAEEEQALSKDHLWLAVIAGGRGTRLFPLSHETHPKQFCQFSKSQTFIQATVQRFLDYGVPSTHIVVTTCTDNQTKLASDQLASLNLSEVNFYQISESYGYAGAIVMTGEYISTLNPDAVIISTPADHHIVADEAFTSVIDSALKSVESGYPTIVGVHTDDLMTVMSCGHALYDPEDKSKVKKVTGFIEKPSQQRAEELLNAGPNHNFAVNTGINVWSADQLMDAIGEMPIVHCFDPSFNTDSLMLRFGEALRLVVGDFTWRDCGTLRAIYEISHKTPDDNNVVLGCGKVECGKHCSGSLFVAAEGTHIIAHAVRDAAVITNRIEGRYVLTVVSWSDSEQVRHLADRYRENKEFLTNDFSLDARNNIVVETAISNELRFAFVGVDNYVVTPLISPDGSTVFSVSHNVPTNRVNRHH